MKRICGFAGVAVMCSAGCGVVPSTGIDLSQRGSLSMLISRESDSVQANAGASIADTAALATLFELDANQSLSVNGVELRESFLSKIGLGFFDAQIRAEVGAREAPDGYEIEFDDAGTVTRMTVVPPADFTSVAPVAGSSVSASGFTVQWSPANESGVLVDVWIEGLTVDGELDDDTLPDAYFASLSNLSDSGSASIGAADLQGFLAGEITVSVLRFRTATQTLGFASGTVRAEVVAPVSLNLAP